MAIDELIARPPAFSYQQLANPLEGYAQGIQFNRQRQLQDALSQGLPRGADGQIDWMRAADTLARFGDVPTAVSLANIGTQLTNDQNFSQRLLGGQQPAPRSGPPPGFAPPAPPFVPPTPRGFAPPAQPPMTADAVPQTDPTMTIPPSQVARVNATIPGAGTGLPVEQTGPIPGVPLSPPSVGRPTPQGPVAGQGINMSPAEIARWMSRLSPGMQAAAKTILEHSLRSGDPPEAVRIAREMMANPGAYGYTGVNDPRLATDIGRRLSGITSPAAQGEGAFSTRFGHVQADRWNAYITQGEQAQGRLADIQQLREISNRVGSPGAVAGVLERVGPVATALGINIDGLSDIQAFNAVIQRIAPQLRVSGSGATSDLEFRGMLRASPSLLTEPAARTAILDTMEAFTRRSIAESEIAKRLATEEITRQQAEQQLRALPDPMQSFRTWQRANPGLYSQAIRQNPQQQGQQQGQGAAQPPAAAINMLRGNPTPTARAQFDEIFGAGAAARVLGRQ